MADEYDSWLRDDQELRGLFNAGHRRGGQALRCEGDNHEVRAFRVFGPAVLCGIGALPGTLHDRSIVIRLERAKPGEIRSDSTLVTPIVRTNFAVNWPDGALTIALDWRLVIPKCRIVLSIDSRTTGDPFLALPKSQAAIGRTGCGAFDEAHAPRGFGSGRSGRDVAR